MPSSETELRSRPSHSDLIEVSNALYDGIQNTRRLIRYQQSVNNWDVARDLEHEVVRMNAAQEKVSKMVRNA